MDDETLDRIDEEVMDVYDRAVEDLSAEDALEAAEQIQSNFDARITGLRNDIERGGG